MKYVYFDASSGLSGDMILGALLDLGADPALFKKTMARLKLPVRIEVREALRSHLRGLKVDVIVERKKPVTRTWADVERIIGRSPFSPGVKADARKVFKRLFEAEARVHGRPFRSAHLHEAGADDALVDVLGACWLTEALGIDAFYCSPLNVGKGFVRTSHGLLPVPPPAVAELLKNIPVYSAGAKEELVTPTGAAVVSTLVREFLPFPEITYGRIGYGAGSRDLPGLPNILRAFYGNIGDFKPQKKVFVVEATIDDSTPQLLAHFLELALKRGALDAFLTPVVMKKNRLATKLTLLAEVDKIDDLIEDVFRETSSIGVRFFPVERRVLERESRKVHIRGEEIGIKVSRLGGEAVNVQPEYADCLKASERTGLPLKEVSRLALREYYGKK
ncbi:nickel pincer cofactor biosynthesis protein LarC [bacterium]|nr:MAG: nickel pincer cofactor biosynthesis protein LarC [bacterium]